MQKIEYVKIPEIKITPKQASLPKIVLDTKIVPKSKRLEIDNIYYETTSKLISHSKRRKSRFSATGRLSPAMEQYLRSPGFSPTLEHKKIEHLDSYFLEKFQLVSSYLNESHLRREMDHSTIKIQNNMHTERSLSAIKDPKKEKTDPVERKLL